MTIQFEVRRHCPVCGAGDHDRLCRIPYHQEPLKSFIETFYSGRVSASVIESAQFSLVQCYRCEFIYQDMILNDEGMAALYQHWVDQKSSLNKKRESGTRLFRQYSGQIQTLQRLFPDRPGQTRILEYGMGWGYWSRMAQAHGFIVSGYELSPARREHAQAMGVEVIEALPEAGPHYQFIFASQVFEHLADPLPTLTALRERLLPGGIVNLRVPDGRGVASYLKARGWNPALDAIHPLEHINCFTRRTLIRLGEEAGLEPFNPPLRLNWGSLSGGLKREFVDRFMTTHVYFRQAPGGSAYSEASNS